MRQEAKRWRVIGPIRTRFRKIVAADSEEARMWQQGRGGKGRGGAALWRDGFPSRKRGAAKGRGGRGAKGSGKAKGGGGKGPGRKRRRTMPSRADDIDRAFHV